MSEQEKHCYVFIEDNKNDCIVHGGSLSLIRGEPLLITFVLHVPFPRKTVQMSLVKHLCIVIF